MQGAAGDGAPQQQAESQDPSLDLKRRAGQLPLTLVSDLPSYAQQSSPEPVCQGR